MAHITHTHNKGSAALFAEMRSESNRNSTIRDTVDGHKQEIAGMIAPLVKDAIERGEIDPAVDLQTLLAILMSVGEGIAINDLPARGIPLDQIEAALRGMLVGMLRPTNKGVAEKA
jgi:hypothetical protein